jgi:hypothetical protein
MNSSDIETIRQVVYSISIDATTTPLTPEAVAEILKNWYGRLDLADRVRSWHRCQLGEFSQAEQMPEVC